MNLKVIIVIIAIILGTVYAARPRCSTKCDPYCDSNSVPYMNQCRCEDATQEDCTKCESKTVC